MLLNRDFICPTQFLTGALIAYSVIRVQLCDGKSRLTKSRGATSPHELNSTNPNKRCQLSDSSEWGHFADLLAFRYIYVPLRISQTSRISAF
jgi:hypothetical protein